MKNKLSSKLDYLYSLDILRVFLCVMVLLFHSVIHKVWAVSNISTFLYREFSAGAICMDGFFMLSGFILYYIYSSVDFSNISILKNFYVKRFIRIYPVYIIYTFIVCLTYHQFNFIVLPAILLGISAFYPILFLKHQMGIGRTWFISVILIAYLCFPILVYLIKLFEHHINKIIIFLYLIIIYSNIIASYWHINKFTIYTNPIYRILIFTIGMCVANILLKKQANEYKFSNLKSFLLFCILLVLPSIMYKNNFFNHTAFAKQWTYYSVLTIPLFGCLIYNLAKCKKGLFYNLAKNTFVQHFSKISFCFYLAQGLSISFVRNYIDYFHLNSIFMIFFITYIFACVLYYCVEKPIVKLYNQFRD